MPLPPRRARFQIHLSTAIVLMFVAGGLIWANVAFQEILLNPETGKKIPVNSILIFLRDATEPSSLNDSAVTRLRQYGWPFIAIELEDEVCARDHRWFELG